MASYIEQYARLLGDPYREGSQYLFTCPFEGCAGYTRKKFRVHPETGAWQCKHCRQVVPGKQYREDAVEPHGGGWRDFVHLIGDEANLHLWPRGPVREDRVDNVTPLPLAEAQEVWTMLFREGFLLRWHREEILQRRGIDPVRAGMVSAHGTMLEKVLQRYGPEHLHRAGLMYPRNEEYFWTKCVSPGRILIPYGDGQGPVRYFVGYQKCPPPRPGQSEVQYQELQDRWAKTAGPTRYPSQVYGEIGVGLDYLIVTEGQLKAIAAIQRGFPCVGISGVSASHATLIQACVEKQVARVIILFDSDRNPETQITVDQEAQRLAHGFLHRGIPVFRVELPLPEGEDKMDLDLFLATHDSHQLVRLLQNAYPLILESDLQEEYTR